MKPSYFILALLCAFSMAFVSCENNDPDTKKGGDDTTSQHQPANPAMWSPAGHIYIYETTWENSPAADHYWVWVINFYSDGEVVEYETPNRDLSYHLDYLNTIDSTSYYTEYPILKYNSPAVLGYIDMVFSDTLSLYWKANNVTYSMFR